MDELMMELECFRKAAKLYASLEMEVCFDFVLEEIAILEHTLKMRRKVIYKLLNNIRTKGLDTPLIL